MPRRHDHIVVLLGLLLGLWSGCGGASGTPADPAPVSPLTPSETAQQQLARGDLLGASRAANRALRLDPTDRRAQEVAARVSLARGRWEEALEPIRDATEPRLVRLRARALFRLGRLGPLARDLASVEEAEPIDGWAVAMLEVARAGRSTAVYETSGSDEVSLDMRAGLPVPVVPIVIDGQPGLAAVATSTDVTVLASARLDGHGIASRVDLGTLTIRNVPALSRDLGRLSSQLGVQIDAVIGLDLLLRLWATLDFAGAQLILRQAAPDRAHEASVVPFVTFDGSFLAVEATLDARAETWVTLDTVATFPVALADPVAEALGHDLSTLPTPDGAPSEEVRMLLLTSLRFGQIQIEEVPAFTGLVPEDLSDLAGAPIGGILGAGLLSGLTLDLRADERAILFR